MSIKCMNWAWSIQLPPTTKLVLMSLADNANDSAECFPSVKYIAKRCCISKRSVQRVLKKLKQKNLIWIHRQMRKNGSNQSNRYVLNLKCSYGDNLTPPKKRQALKQTRTDNPDDLSHDPATTTTRLDDTHDTPLTTIKSPKESTTTNSVVVWPDFLNEAHQASILKLVRNLNPVVVQLLLDELAGQKGKIKNPVGYFHSLLKTHISGDFVPAQALGAQAKREAHHKNEHALAKVHEKSEEQFWRQVKRHQKKNDD